MLSYQHAFHAGNHADILKHYVLSFVLNSLNKKDKPYTFFDTHSGSGLYDLEDNRSIKTGEAEKGILFLYNEIKKNKDLLSSMPDSFANYFNLVEKYLSSSRYPGSPEIERMLLRKSDFLVLSELHPQEIENLKTNIQKKPFISSENAPSIQIHNRNGWEMIKALTPPKTKRGAVIIDPSYEETQDYLDAANTILSVNKKWSNGIILLWYPLLAHRDFEINQMINSICEGIHSSNENTEIVNLQLCVADKDSHKEVALNELDKKNPPRLYGSGMLVINAPWMLQEDATQVIPKLQSILS